MELRETILGLLSWQPFSGYDLKRIISDSDIFYWSGNNNQIYKTLMELHNQGLVSQQVHLQEGLPAKKVYSITAQGVLELKRSLVLPPELPEVRKAFLIQLAWSELLPDNELLFLLDKYEEEVCNRLRMYQARAAQPVGHPRRSRREDYLWQQIADNLVLTLQVELDWIHRVRQGIQAKEYLHKDNPAQEENHAHQY